MTGQTGGERGLEPPTADGKSVSEIQRGWSPGNTAHTGSKKGLLGLRLLAVVLGSPLTQALVITILVSAPMVGLALADYGVYRGRPVEQAVVTDVGRTLDRISCGTRSVLPDTDEEVVQYRSENPPSDLPPVFTTSGCPSGTKVGDRLDVARVDGEVFRYPAGSALGVLGEVGWFAPATFLIAYPVLLCRRRYRRWRRSG